MYDKVIHGRPLIYGEALLDIFPDNTSVFGGAPFNVAWHLCGFGLDPLFISRIGSDKEGEKLLLAMESWGMDTKGLQVDHIYPTGSVQVYIKNGKPSFVIKTDQAYDFIDIEEVINIVRQNRISLFYHGSLISRTIYGFKVLQMVIKAVNSPVFVDLNFRQQHWQPEYVKQLLSSAIWVKLNEEELNQVLHFGDIQIKGIEEAVQKLRSRFGLFLLIVTLGEKGAFVAVKDESFFFESPVVTKIVDTVGAGDAFSAVVILGLNQGWSLDLTMNRAVEFASSICAIKGAISLGRELYDRYLTKWEL